MIDNCTILGARDGRTQGNAAALEVRVHLGVFMECEYRMGRTEAEAFDEAFALADAIEADGLDGVWLAERHFARLGSEDTGVGGVPSIVSAPLVVATAIASRTSRVRIGTAVSVLPLQHPLNLAEQVATLDHVSGGRLDFGAGRSGFVGAYKGYGVAYEESRERFQESLDILRLAWTQPSFSYTGRFYSCDDVSVVPKPLQKPYPPIRIAATTSETFPRLGREGYPIFVGLRGTNVPETAGFVASYRKAWRDAGHDGDGDVYLRIPAYVAATAERAYEEPRESLISSYRRRADRYADSSLAFGTSAADRQRAAESLRGSDYDEMLVNRVAYGTPDAVIKQMFRLRDVLGLNGFLIEPNAGGGVSRDLVFESVRLFAREVAPALR
jgi:alkanesulfonate monooxygenase SsuD/methylene tetrahydromethanopterin reductase-like flavin-dependent oxidoreductase (luciferase family)